ncbi:MAG: DoxX family protein [Deltaproteobacteria bacterium]|nr:DoxX family protein [Deltaproteobacteria bacterium]
MANADAVAREKKTTEKASRWKPFVRAVGTTDDPAALLLRLALGVMILPHGMQKLFGWFGGYGFSGTVGFFTDTLGIPWILGVAAILAEFFGGLALVAGFLTRMAALAVGTVMLVAMTTVHLQHGFFMNWFGNQKGEGIEFFLLAIGIAATLVLKGGGSFSIDRKLAEIIWRRS